MKIKLCLFFVFFLLLVGVLHPKKTAADIVDDFNDNWVNGNLWQVYDPFFPTNPYNRYTCITGDPGAWGACEINCPEINPYIIEEFTGADGLGKLRLRRDQDCAHRFMMLRSTPAYNLNSSFYDATARVRLNNQQGWGVGWGVEGLLAIWYYNDYTNATVAWRKPDGAWGVFILQAGDENWHTFRFRHELLSCTSARFRAWVDDMVTPKEDITYSFSGTPPIVSGQVWFGNTTQGQCEGWNSCDKYSTGAGPWPWLVADYVDIRHLPATCNEPPSCSSLTVPATIQRGETVNISITGTDPNGNLSSIEAYYSPTSSQSWTKIGSQSCSGSSCTRTFSWNTTSVPDGDYWVVGNVYDTDGAKCSGNPWGVSPGWSSCPNCRKKVTIFTPRTWTIQYEAVCANGREPTGQTRSVYGLWPPNPLVWHYGSYGDAGTVRSQTITNEHPWNNIYFWMQNQAESALPLYGSPPHPAIKYGTYFSPPTPMAEWKWSELPEGTYKINFLAPDTWCAPPPLPDLVAQSLSYSPSSPVEGNSMSFSGVVTNQGTGGAGASTTRLRLDVNNDGTWDWLPGNQPTGALAPNATETETWSGWTAVAGTHKYEICADVGGAVNESNEGNNCATQIFTVTVPLGSITGKIWNDESNVGGSCETDVTSKPAYTGSEATITYSLCSNPPCSALSDFSGNYRFENVPVSGYQVSVSFPPGSSWFVTSDNPCPVNIEAAGDVKIANFGVSNNPLSWFQGVNGDIYGNGITVSVPSQEVWSTNPPPGYNRWFLDADPYPGTHLGGGVVISGSTDNPSCGGGGAGRCSRRPNENETEPGWCVKDETMTWPSLPSDISGDSPPPWGNLVAGVVYQRTGTWTIPGATYRVSTPGPAPDEGVAVIYVDGDLAFTTQSFRSIDPNKMGVIFIVKNGQAIIDKNVRRIDAVILVTGSGKITVEGDAAATNNLTVQGMLYAQNGFQFGRTLENNRIPAVQVRYNPLYFHRSNPLATSRITWREIAP